MILSYLVTEDDNKKLNLKLEVIKWFVDLLDCTIRRGSRRADNFAVMELVDVR